MITFDQLRTALLDADPHRALDRLIRTELSAGRKTTAISDELLGHVDAVRAMPEYTDDLEDPLGDKLDALCGWCHRDYAYRDAPEPGAVSLARPAAETNGHPAATVARATPPT